ncbi:head-tail connector protein [Pseudorhodoplanes sp.]|uniref:head-tail connector protein n=1 Tax=Pseudorhodoplanes sp. TaxID=1934341 RepID=UPI003D146A89
MSAILLTPPALEPVSLADAKHFLRVAHDDDDDVIAALIAAARVHVEAQTRRALIEQTWRLVRDVWPAAGRLPVLPVPLVEVAAIRVFDADGMPELLDVDDFAIDRASAPAVLAFVRGAPPAPGKLAAGIEIDIVAGYGDEPDAVPQPLRQAIRMLVAHWYENRGVIAASGEVASMPVSVSSMIAPFRVLSL